jgi:hypothetical protein
MIRFAFLGRFSGFINNSTGGTNLLKNKPQKIAESSVHSCFNMKLAEQ